MCSGLPTAATYSCAPLPPPLDLERPRQSPWCRVHSFLLLWVRAKGSSRGSFYKMSSGSHRTCGWPLGGVDINAQFNLRRMPKVGLRAPTRQVIDATTPSSSLVEVPTKRARQESTRTQSRAKAIRYAHVDEGFEAELGCFHKLKLPSWGCVYNKSPTIRRLYQDPLICGNSHLPELEPAPGGLLRGLPLARALLSGVSGSSGEWRELGFSYGYYGCEWAPVMP